MTKAPIKPMYEHILVKRDEEKEKTKGGIIIPHEAREKPIRGHVLEVGCGRIKKSGEKESQWINPGDRVIYTEHAEEEVEVKGEKFLMIMDQDVFGVIEETDQGEKIRPLNDRLIIKKEVQKETKGGIILTEETFDDHHRGEVISKGQKVTVDVGDKVIFNKVDGLEFEYLDQEFLMLRDKDLYAVIESAS